MSLLTNKLIVNYNCSFTHIDFSLLINVFNETLKGKFNKQTSRISTTQYVDFCQHSKEISVSHWIKLLVKYAEK